MGLVVSVRLVKKGRKALEEYALQMLPPPAAEVDPASSAAAPDQAGTPTPQPPVTLTTEAAESPQAAPADAAEPQRRKEHEETIRRWFYLLERFTLITVFLLGLWIAGHIVHLSKVVDTVVLFAIRLLAILMVSRLLTLACRTLSHTLATLGNRHLGAGKFKSYWERVTRLFPFGERCFEAAVYISAASLLIRELEFIAVIADLGPRLVQCIGIFFITRVIIELLSVLLNEGFGVHDEERPLDQKTQTLLPLLLSISQYALYFGSAVIMLGVVGIDTTPILAGAGIIGLAAGLGAQSLVTDVVSGFFILFENQYLVGDMVKIGEAEGRVEAVSIRHTQVRDEQGKLYIIPNGQIKSVINYSKGFINAVVDIKVPASHSLEQIARDLAEAGRRLRQARREVLGETIVQGLVELTPSDMTVRAVTRVQPGKHQLMQSEFRRMLKTVLDERRDTNIRAAA
jgi:small conductance mechanosensitive channel